MHLVKIKNSKAFVKAYHYGLKYRLTYPYPRFWIISISLVFLVWFYFSLPHPLFQSPCSTLILDKNGKLLGAQLASDQQWRFPKSDSVPYRFRESVRCFEDEYFAYHPGVNPVSLFRALVQYYKKGHIVSGASTINMQVIRLSRNNPPRTWAEKLYELLLSVRLELGYSKEEIMNLYASHAPFGGNVVGLEAASWRYFQRPSSALSWGESASLAVLPNSPSLIYPGKNHLFMLKKRNKLLEKLCRLKIIDRTTCELAKTEPLPCKPHALPQQAPHLLAKSIRDGYGGRINETTLDGRIQQMVNETAGKYGRYYAQNYINNIAIVVMDTRTGAILAYTGNVNPDHQNNHQYVDNVISNRSSGSILKPFLYAAMLEEGSLLPDALVSDIPTRIGSYSPDNFDKTYQGAVPASLALAHSLNIPAVRELEQYGVIRFHHILQSLGFSTINRPAENYGLALILGAAEVSLLEATSVYASMGRSLLSYHDQYGKYSQDDYHMGYYMKQDARSKSEQENHALFSAGSIWYTFKALSSVNRPWGETGWEFFASTHKIAWKTGTSFGFRDAWSIGVTPEYSIGVWVGNSSGEGRPGLTGLSHAAPVMFELFKYLNPTHWFDEPRSDMQRIAICHQSGYRAGSLCEADTLYVPSKGVRMKQCPYHQQVFLDSTGRYRVTASCYPVSSMRIVTRFILSPTQEYFYRQQHPEYEMLPPYMAGCEAPGELMLDIMEPDNNSAIYIPRGVDGEEGKLLFQAVHRLSTATLYWHIDKEYVAQTHGNHQIEVRPTPGRHVLTVEDENGNIVSRRFNIVKKL